MAIVGVFRISRCYFGKSQKENVIPLYERKSREKFKKLKLLKKIKIRNLYLNNNVISNIIVNKNKFRNIFSKNNFQILYKPKYNIFDNNDVEKCNNNLDISSNSFLTIINEICLFEKQNKKENNILMNKNENINRITKLNQELVNYTHLKSFYFFITKKNNHDVVKYINNTNLLKLSIFMNTKNIRNYFIEKEFLKRLCKEGLQNNEKKKDGKNEMEQTENHIFYFSKINIFYVFEFLHHIGLNNVKKERIVIEAHDMVNYHMWSFSKLENLYTLLLKNLTNNYILENNDIIKLLLLGDRYLYFNKNLFNYLDSTISMRFENFDEHDITFICKHLNKILFSISIGINNINYDQKIHRLIKRYVCKSLIFSNKTNVELLEKESCKEKNIAISEQIKTYNSFKDLVKNSSFVHTINCELKKCVHEYKYYNLIDLFEFYTIFEIKKKGMFKRFMNEIDKYINIMKYGYHAKALILFSLNKKYLKEENEKTVRKLIRRIPHMLNFYWPIEFVIETIIACSYFQCKDKTYKQLFLYLKNNIKKSVHQIIIINLLKSMSIINKINFTIFHQIMNYIKYDITKNNNTKININYTIYMLKYMSKLKYIDSEFFYFLLSQNNVFKQIKDLSNESLINLFYLIHKNIDYLKKKKKNFINKIYIKNSIANFYIEYVFYLILNRENFFNLKKLKTNENICVHVEKGKLKWEIGIKKYVTNLFFHYNESNNQLPFEKKESKIIYDKFISTNNEKFEKTKNVKENTILSIDDKDEISSFEFKDNKVNENIKIHHIDIDEKNTAGLYAKKLEEFPEKCSQFSFDINTFIYFLKVCTDLKITNINILNYCINYVHSHLNFFNEHDVIILFQFFSEQYINFFSSIQESQIRILYSYLNEVLRKNILHIHDHHLPQCAFSVISFYFVEIVLKKKVCPNNIDLLEILMAMLCNKMRGGLQIFIEKYEPNEQKKITYELLNIISKMLQMLYMIMERRMPNELFDFCKHIKKEYFEINEDITSEKDRASQQFTLFLSDLFRNKKIAHFVKYFYYPYMIDIVIEENTNEDFLTHKKKALFVIDNLENLYLKNVQITEFFENCHSENASEKKLVYENCTTTCLKPYYFLREWFLNSSGFSVLYVSIDDWKKMYK
ncbi:conserved Plasmodium protein, unknown function [Plasmodium berghei]|uniref:Uncharacterized protein n=2 Tax=Plasmodium berghei TaxID=5821 RepID=A0A509AG67_PLABA|nr:conserved Plasmodium protein, unknown function [Plasmodium berghei ANKA]CXI09102.1 conserved Plasmodium protein, unknown function [Plasmodium berghei]SCL92818.1 conserved Plasmodium protein, unknown function [Plasmodium berghei]SCM15726.1 conserved Plasmodium protein, unknown function [Plasmodium berghei]SCM17521.1 conserved Plasmodium protein, unknown function [Plasmodium berghei]SCN22928.1 conserved Plasmodium protein, unknown function [Plasmodium berghei]|eukprot:XP_034420332.1 conserved Plasmodium protein, unknown function [Plasmodium berghei ANKA]